MRDFIVKIVERDKLHLWHALWDNPAAPSIAAQEANRDGSLGQTRHIRAKNRAEAADIAERQNPGFVAMRDATEGPL
jgi:hypothetical protein